MKYAFIQAESAVYPVTALCSNLDVSPSGYYAWRSRKPSKRELSNQELLTKIKGVRQGRQRCYGSPRVFKELRARGECVSRKRVEHVMRDAGIAVQPRRAFKKTTNSSHSFPLAPNLLKRNFKSSASNTAWVADVTYLATGQGWLYLAVVLDLFSRRVVGWAMHENNDSALTVASLRLAAATRKPKRGLIFHSDRGSTYACYEHRKELERYGMIASMSRRGDCWDNAVAESFFATLRAELTDEEHFDTRDHARMSVKAYIEDFYNIARRHSTVEYLSPIEYELRMSAKAA